MTLRFPFLGALLFSSFVLFGQDSPVQGDDLLKCLGQPKSSELVTKLNNFIGNKDPKEDISFLNYGKGIQVNIAENTLKSIDVYNDNNPYSTEFKRFPGKLPLDITFDNTVYQVKQKMGDGYETTGEVTATLQLSKVFRLNDDDDYRMLIEFNIGRMVMLSISYIEGGSGDEEADSTGAVSKSLKFRGNDFFTMIRKNQYNFEYSRFIGLLGQPTLGSKSQRLYVHAGVDVRFQKGIIESVTLYSGGQGSDYKGMSFQPYTLDLPYGIRMENSKSAIVKKLGEPTSQSGSVLIWRQKNVDFQIAFKGEKIDYVKFVLTEETK